MSLFTQPTTSKVMRDHQVQFFADCYESAKDGAIMGGSGAATPDKPNHLRRVTVTPTSEYRTISLTQGQVAIVDAGDFEWLNQWKWFAHRCSRSGNFYAYRSDRLPDGRSTTIAMHRQILGLERGDPREGDHVESSETLNNQRSNLRIATRSAQNMNRRRAKHNTSGFKGVTSFRGKWMSRVSAGGKNYFLGYFDTPELAHMARIQKVHELHGEFARLS